MGAASETQVVALAYLQRHVERFDRYEELIDVSWLKAAVRILKLS